MSSRYHSSFFFYCHFRNKKQRPIHRLYVSCHIDTIFRLFATIFIIRNKGWSIFSVYFTISIPCLTFQLFIWIVSPPNFFFFYVFVTFRNHFCSVVASSIVESRHFVSFYK